METELKKNKRELDKRVAALRTWKPPPVVLTDPILDGFVAAARRPGHWPVVAYMIAAIREGQLAVLLEAVSRARWLIHLTRAAAESGRLDEVIAAAVDIGRVDELIDAAGVSGRLNILIDAAFAAGRLNDLVDAATYSQRVALCDAACV